LNGRAHIRALAIDPKSMARSAVDLDLLTPDDVCTLLKVKKIWLYDTVESGVIEAIRLGKQLRFRPSAIASYLTDRARAEKRT
jgi:excisionase family DNA binding protein